MTAQNEITRNSSGNSPPEDEAKLTTEEKDSLEKMEGKLQHLRDTIKGVAKGYHTGLFIHGEGGTSKSYTVFEELKKLKCNYALHNTRLTGRGLVDKLRNQPGTIHLIEDAETLLDDKKAFGVLRSALWSQSKAKPMERPVTWGAFKTDISFTFTGGIIVISNVNLAEASPEIRAIKTRINILKIDFTPDEIKALMKKICLNGHEYGDLFLDPTECLTVRKRVIDRLTELKRSLDLRLMVNGFRDFIQWQNGDSKLHWHDLLEGRMQERINGNYEDRATRNASKKRIALEIHSQPITWAEKIKLAKNAGMSAAAYGRALKRGA